MPRRIPDDDRLEDAIRTVMRKSRQTDSLTSLTDLVKAELKKENDDYSVSGRRIRRVLTERNILTMNIEYNVSDDPCLPDICPVCGYPVETVSNSTLDGMETDVGRHCTKCSYKIGLKKLTPRRYTFSIVRPSSRPAERQDIIRDAETLIRKAASMIENATKGTEHAKKGKKCAACIRRTVSDEKGGCGIASLIDNMKNGDKNSDPVWTRPLASVKDGNLKNI